MTVRRKLKAKDIERLEASGPVGAIIEGVCTESICMESSGMCTDTNSDCCCSATCEAMSCVVWTDDVGVL